MIEFKEPDMIVIINRRCSNDVQLMELNLLIIRLIYKQY